MLRTKWQLGAFAAFLSALLSTAASATPNGTALPRAHAAHAAQHKSAPNPGNAAALAALHQAHALLAGANHDYNGHRAKAEANISQAIHELSGHKHQARTGATVAAGNKGAAGAGNKESQAQSDAQLKQALQLLSGLHGHVPNTHKAATHVQSAITELNAALKVK